MLKIDDLRCEVEDTEILKGIDLDVKPGETHVLMGPNGSGKSTLAKTLAGHPAYEITGGTIELDGEDIIEMEADERSHAGLFMAFQYPVEVPGVNFGNFLRMAYNSRLEEGKKLPVFKFRQLLKEKAALLGMDEKFLDRNLNEGLSGGEKKKAEILQMAILEPKYVVLDETDSGLDLDALKIVFGGIKKLAEVNKKMGIIIITHYQRIFDYIQPDHVHIVSGGKIVKSGDMSLVDLIEKDGYKQFS